MKTNFKISLQFSMLSIFLSLFIVTMLTIIIVTTLRIYESMVVISRDQMHQVTELTNNRLSAHINPAESAGNLAEKLIRRKIVDIKKEEEVIAYTQEALKSMSSASMVYWGDTQGNFVISRLESNNTISSEVINRSNGNAKSTHISRDSAGKIIDTKTTDNVTYDPRQRPWYKAAELDKKTTWSNAYIFFTGETKTLGITSASPVYNENSKLMGVVGIDMKLGVISEFLSKLKVGKTGVAFILDKDGNLIAHPKLLKLADKSKSYSILPIQALGDPHLTKAFSEYKKHNKKEFNFTHNKKTYIVAFQLIPSFSKHQWSIGVVIPENDFVGELKKTNMITLTLSSVILLIGILLITIFSKSISSQMKKLVHQTEKIKNFDLSDSKKINSHIKEVSLLASGISSMRSGLKAFKMYVPADLVRKLIRKRESAKLGGTMKKICILFTDIENFTSISEKLTPEDLMLHLCDYFDHVSKMINNEKGTIDKYIGDAIMAFWGSPIADDNQSYHACKAAMAIQNELKKLNASWDKQKKPIFPTRIGIHTGNAIVGNLGSSERINYTAIGDTINLSSRLEMINKVYGTNVIVSEEVMQETKDHFIFKELDCIAVKGKTESTLIYELVASKKDNNANKFIEECNLYSIALEHYRKGSWEMAIDAYNKILSKKPNDPVATLFISRCETLMETPLPKDWDGVWRFTEK